MENHHYFMLNKPVGIVSQFLSSHDVPLLGNLKYDFPPGTHAIGRLDRDSAGLLLLTTDQSVTRRLFQGAVPHKREYLVDVNRKVPDEVIRQLAAGVSIPVGDGVFYDTKPCETARVIEPEIFSPHIRRRDPRIPQGWIWLSLTEGKYHQVRKMVQAVGHPCRQLIRVAIEDMKLGELPPGGVIEYSRDEFYGLLHLS